VAFLTRSLELSTFRPLGRKTILAKGTRNRAINEDNWAMYRSSLARDNNTSGTGALGERKVSLPPPPVTDVDIVGTGELLVGLASGLAFWDMVVIGTVGEMLDSTAVVSLERLEAADGRIVELMIAGGKELWE